ncbi:MAG: DUF2723 domain-containing protein [Rhodopirellula sp.]|nr:DUF2723 domain-containing protein [Rhodopirellula sp.]
MGHLPLGNLSVRRLVPLWFGCFLAFALLYVATCQRGPGWHDSGLLQYRIWTQDYEGRLGVALAHPLHIALGQIAKLVPGAFCWATGALSGIAMAAALANLACLVAELTGRRWVGAMTSGLLAVCHAVWWISTVTEVYTLSVAGLTVELWLLRRLLQSPRPGCAVALGLISGLGLANHNFALLPLPVYATAVVVLAMRQRIPKWTPAATLAAWLVGASPVLIMTVRLAMQEGSVVSAAKSALFGVAWAHEVLNISGSSSVLKANLVLMSLNFFSAIAPLAVVGWIAMRRRMGAATAAAFAAITVIHVVFVVRYSVPDQFTFALPALTMVAVAAGLGMDDLCRRGDRWREGVIAACCATFLLQPAAYAAAPRVFRAAKIAIPAKRDMAFLDEHRWFLTPWKHDEDSAHRFAVAALAQAGPNGVVLRDTTAVFPMLVLRDVSGMYPGVAIQSFGRLEGLPSCQSDPALFRRAVADRPVFLVNTEQGTSANALRGQVTLQRGTGEVLHRVVWSERIASRGRIR